MEYRDYQDEIDERIDESWKTHQNVLAVLPTGAGKSVVVSRTVKKTQGGVCVIAHRQELVSQMSMHLARDGIYHNIISSQSVVRMINKMHLQEYGQLFYRDNAKVAVAGVDTIIRRGHLLERWLPTVKLWVIDECFPAGTMVDDKPIETIKLGDYVTAFNEKTGEFSQREVKRLFKNKKPKYVVRLETETHHVVESTENHPYWTKRGWVNACDLTVYDEVLIYDKMFHVRQSSTYNSKFKKNRQSILLQEMFKQISFKNIFRNNEKNKSEICERAYEKEQPNEKRIYQKKNVKYIEKNGTSTENSRRQWARSDQSGKGIKKTISMLWLQITNDCKNRIVRSIKSITLLLQNRLWSQGVKDSNRSRRSKSQYTRTQGAGRSQGQSAYWTRLDSVQIFKPYNNDEQEDSFVYNIEVDEEHTYTANGIVVHNCHHVIYDNDNPDPETNKDNKWGKAIRMFPNAKGLGVTATPLRLDGKGLGRHADGCFDNMIVGTDMRTLINRGFLTDYRIFSPATTNFNRAEIKTTTTGELSKLQVNKAVGNSGLVAHDDSRSIVGDVVKSYQKFANNQLGVVFVPNMDIGKELEIEFNSVGIPAELVNAKTPDNERALSVKRLSSGETKILLNVALFDEGFDLPAISFVSDASPTMSYGRFSQRFGRMLRLFKGKTHGIYIDHVGNVAGKYGHGLPDAPRTWTLDAQDKNGGNNSAINPIKTCNNCMLSYERYLKACPECGHVDTPAERTIEQVDGSLTELSPEFLRQLRGEVLSIDRPIDEQVDEYVANLNPHIKPVHASRHIKNFRKKVEANVESQRELRLEMAQWAGYRRAEGRTDDEIHKIWYTKFGIDWLSSQSLTSIDADKLKEWLTTGKKY